MPEMSEAVRPWDRGRRRRWLRLPDYEQIDPPDAPPEVLRDMKAQSKLVDDYDARASDSPRDAYDVEPRAIRTSRDDNYDDEPRSSRSSRDDDYDDRSPRRSSSYDDDDDDYDSPRRRSDRYSDDDDDGGRRKPPDGMGVASMILGICSTATGLGGCCCFFAGISLIVGILAVIFGFVGRSKNPASSTAKTGLITGFIGIALSIVMTVIGIALRVMNK
jgi:hypothetical protein